MKAILQVADTGPLESLVVMLRSVGIECFLPPESLKRELRGIGCDTVLDIASLVKGWGYDLPMPLPEADLAMMERFDTIYFDIKAHRNGPLVVKRWPNLAGKVCWYRINGGKPEHVVNARGDHGDEINPGCPILTPNLWYAQQYLNAESWGAPTPWYKSAYAMWPPFHRFEEYDWPRPYCESRKVGARIAYAAKGYDLPICLIHNLQGWGYGDMIDGLRKLGVLCYGNGSPDGLIPHREIKVRLTNAVAMVHLKSSDAPGYALYEALAAGCPVICSRRLIWRNRMQDLFIPGKTCLVFDRETHDGLSPQEVISCTEEIKGHLSALSNPSYNQAIGQAGRERLRELMWSQDRPEDVASLTKFMGKFKG